MKNIFTLAVSLIFLSYPLIVKAQNVPPVISSFLPDNGRTGTTVTIKSSGFNSDGSKNIVFFGAVRATVTSANANTLVVTIPAGAAYTPISVLNLDNNLMANTPQYFRPHTNSIPSVQPNTDFATNALYAAGKKPTESTVGDLDGDGKLDIVTANFKDGTISVLLNNKIYEILGSYKNLESRKCN